METYHFERVIGENGIIVLPDSVKKLMRHKVRFTVNDLEKSPWDESSEDDDKLLGLFSDETELMDQITEWAMKSREKDSLR
jgi:hypothetical protein